MIAVLIVLLLQDADRLVQQLGDDEIEARERAAQKLVEMGPAARPALEKAARGTDLEVAGRARSVLGDIALAENRKKVFGKVGRVTIPEGEYSLEKVANAVKEQTEVALSVPRELAPQRLKIGARDELLWPFVDRLCALHGGVRLAAEQGAEAITLEKGAPGRAPTYYSGPFRLWLERLKLERRNPFEGGWDRASFVLDFAWPPNVRPMGNVEPGKLVVKEIVGDDGKALKVNPEIPELYPHSMSWGSRQRTHREFFTFEFPGRGVRKLSRLRGTADLVFPLKVETIAFEKPLDTRNASKAVGAFKATIDDFRATPDGITGKIKLQSPVENRDAPGRAQRASLDSRFRSATVSVVDGRGKEFPGTETTSMTGSTSNGDGSTWEEIERGFRFKADSAASLRFEFVTEYFEKVIDFEFKDVELP